MIEGVLKGPAYSEALARSNPVRFLEVVLRGEEGHLDPLRRRAAAVALQQHGVALPERVRSELHLPSPPEEPRPGVVGLLVAEVHGEICGLVCPLGARRAEVWRLPVFLPFGSDDLQRGLGSVMRHSGQDLAGVVPEALAFEFTAPELGHMSGRSMDVAALLAILDELSGRRCPLLGAACSLVWMPEGGSGRFQAVDQVRTKLEAFERELGRGTLLICASETEAKLYAAGFDEVWVVTSWAELICRLREAELLAPLLEARELSAAEYERALSRLNRQSAELHRHAEAWDLARRLESCALSEELPLELVQRARIEMLRPLRLLGKHRESAELSAAHCEYLEGLGDLVSYEQLAAAANTHAASLFFSHGFSDGIEVLRPWLDRIEQEPRLFGAELRAHLLTTAARLGSALGVEESRSWVESARELQQRGGAKQQRKTVTHHAEVLLRLGDDEGARKIVEELWGEVGAEPPMHNLDLWFAALYKAELARRRGERELVPQLEDVAFLEDRQAGHVVAYYYQATARQAGRDSGDRVARLDRAALLCERNRVEGGLYELLADLLRLSAAATRGDGSEWRLRAERLQAEVSSDLLLTRWYGALLDQLGEAPDVALAEALLDSAPPLLGRAVSAT